MRKGLTVLITIGILLIFIIACDRIAQSELQVLAEDPIEVFVDPSAFENSSPEQLSAQATEGTTLVIFNQANKGPGSPTLRYAGGQLIARITDMNTFNRFVADYQATVLSTNITVAPAAGVTKTRAPTSEVYKLISFNTNYIPTTTSSQMEYYLTTAENMEAQYTSGESTTQAIAIGNKDVYFDSQNALNLAGLALSVNTGARSYPGVTLEPNSVLETNNLNALEQLKTTSPVSYRNVGEDFWWLKNGSGGLDVVTRIGGSTWAGAWTRTVPGVSTKLTGDNVTIAIIDTGFLPTNPDISGYDPVDKRSESKRFVVGYDFPNRDYDPTTPFANASACVNNTACFHGLHSAISAAGIHDNHYGISGVAPDANLQLFNTAVTTSLYIGWSGMYNAGWAVDTANHWGADIINMSFTAYMPFRLGIPFTYLGAALQRAYNSGVINVAAYGNSGWNIPHYTLYPIPGSWATVIGVGASTSTGSRASFSNYGNGIDLFAPGINLLRTPQPGSCPTYFTDYCANNPDLDSLSGTSFASPEVAGVIALMKQKRSSITPGQALSILQSTARTSADSTVGKRLVDALSAVDAVQ